MNDLFSPKQKNNSTYTSKDIEVLEGLEPVRRRPGMYIGGTDQEALHQLFLEVLDNSIDEAVAGYANRIDVEIKKNNVIKITDNGRGIPVEKHPKYPNKTALEIIFTMLHSGGKFSNKSYNTSGGLHGVGISVVNALSSELIVEVARDKKIWRQKFQYGIPQTKLENIGTTNNRRGTSIEFKPDESIFKANHLFNSKKIIEMAKIKAYLTKGVEIRCVEYTDEKNAEKNIFNFPNGISDYLKDEVKGKGLFTSSHFIGKVEMNGDTLEWVVAWLAKEESGFIKSHCNTINTPLGGTHVTGFKQALLKGLKLWGELSGNKKSSEITIDDILPETAIIISVFLKDPEFQGQTKEKLVNQSTIKFIENSIRDPFDFWLSRDPSLSKNILDLVISRSEERKKRKKEKEISRKGAVKKFRLPGKLSDCILSERNKTELFLVEGDSAGGSAKQARDRNTQAVLPLRGKILNVASASDDKLFNNQEISDLKLAIGINDYQTSIELIRYGKIIIMTDADVDGAHIAALLMTFFYIEMPQIIEKGFLYLAQPPLFRIKLGDKTEYAIDEMDRDKKIKTIFNNSKKVEVNRFKGLGEMPSKQLKETTMSKQNRRLIQVKIPNRDIHGADERTSVDNLVTTLMGKKAELRFDYIRKNAPKASITLDI